MPGRIEIFQTFAYIVVQGTQASCGGPLKLTEDPHRRLNPLTNEWVLVSPYRAGRPWQGQVEKIAATHEPEYDPTCYLCPGNPRAGGTLNPRYTRTFVFENDFAALKPGVRDDRFDLENHGLLVAEAPNLASAA